MASGLERAAKPEMCPAVDTPPPQSDQGWTRIISYPYVNLYKLK
jgi:hypothetical protein